jgi:uncharacterized membrane protein
MMSEPTPDQPKQVDLRVLTHVVYGLFALGLVTWVFAAATVAAIVIIYVKRADVAGTVYASHFNWLSYTFWWALLWVLVSLLGTYIFIGYLGLVVTTVWALYRVVKGWLALLEFKTP